MKANIYSHDQLIATTDLRVGDRSMGGVFGQFIPTDLYFRSVQNLVWKIWAENKPDYKKWQSLRLNVQLENGYFLHPAGGYTIEDDSKLPGEPKRISIAGLDSFIIEDFFLEQPPRPFMEEPWEEISIQQKIGFENELDKEIGLTEKTVFDVFRLKEQHPLADFEFSALSKCGCSDDVLFSVMKKGFDKRFAVIHLTWKGKKEIANYPFTEFFADFDEFKYRRMYPDKAEWEY